MSFKKRIKNKIIIVSAIGLATICSSCVSGGFSSKGHALKGITKKPKHTFGTYATNSFGTIIAELKRNAKRRGYNY